MERISRYRAAFLLALFGLVMMLYVGKLLSVQVVETKGNTNNEKTYTSYVTVKASRGDLLDRNGNVLVGNRASYNLVFNHYVIQSADNRNDSLRLLLAKAEELGMVHADHLPISAGRPFEYTLQD